MSKLCIRLGLIWNLKNVAHNPIGQSQSKITKIAKIAKIRDFSQLWGSIIPKLWHLSNFPCTHILICLVLTQALKDIGIEQKLRPQSPFKICNWEMAIIVANLLCCICIIILSVWSYLQSCAMSYLQHLFTILNCSTFYMKWNAYFSWIAREFTSKFCRN